MKKHAKLIILVGVGLISLIAILLARPDSSPPPQPVQTAVSDIDNDFGYDQVLDAYDKAERNGQIYTNTTPNRSVTGHDPNNVPNQTNTDYYNKEDDSLVMEMQRQIKLMQQQRNASGINASNIRNNSNNGSTSNANNAVYSNSRNTVSSREDPNEAYRKKLLQARDQQRQSSDFSRSSGTTTNTTSNTTGNIEFRCAVYRDQFILPGDRVTLILTEPLVYKGNVFEKNTFIYAVANINRSRVLLDITNINHVPVFLYAKDIQDGRDGLYSKRAGELWREFKQERQTDAVDDALEESTRDINVPLVGNAIRAFGNFFSRKKYREGDKIPLFNDRELILTINHKK